jgi:uncharacterized protein YndB with AHSA1/START domain
MIDKQQFQIEYSFHTSDKLLFSRLGNASGLSEWFADDVIELRNNVFVFRWKKSEQKAEKLDMKLNEFIRFRWLDEDDDEDSYFEFRIQKEELTKSISLIVTDFAEEGEKTDSINLWNNQIEKLKKTLGVNHFAN